jgi:CHAP domain
MSGVLALAIVPLSVMVGTATPAAAAPVCSAVEVAAGAWLGGTGVTVHSNGPDQGTGSSCAAVKTANPSVQDGYGWQCVELATRLYAVKGWGRVFANGGVKAGKYRYGAEYIPEGSPGLVFHPNGSGYLPVPGDLIIESYPSGWGHVSVVDKTIGSSVYAIEQNATANGHHTYTLSGATLTGAYGGSVRGFMHAPKNTATRGSNGGTAVFDGTFIQVAGQPQIYRVAGGAPTYVSNWAPFGGAKPVTVISQATFNTLAQVPADGTFVVGAQRGDVYRMAGGAPTVVSAWAAFGGVQPTIAISPAAIDNAGKGGVWNHLNYRPANGTFVTGAQRGEVYRFAGGAPFYVSTWTPFGGVQSTVTIDQVAIDKAGTGGAFNHLSYRPADGTFVTAAQRQEVYRFAGGAPLYVSTWAAFGGKQPTVLVDQAALDNAGATSGAFSHSRLTPADGTFLTGLPSGRPFLVTSGVATSVPSWTPYGGPKPTVTVNDADLDHAGAGVPWQHLISATPVATMNALPTSTTAPAVTLSWTAPVSSSALSSFDVRVQSGSTTTLFTPWQYPASWSALTATSVQSQALSPGGMYCYSVRAHNLAGQTGAWSPAQCVTANG